MKLDATGNPLLSKCIDADGFTAFPDGGFITESTLERDTTAGDVNCTVLDRDSEGSEVMLARYDAQGNWLATQCAADPGYQYMGNVAPDPAGMFFMTAAFNVQLTLPDGTIAQPVDDYYSALIAKVDVNR